MSSLYSLFLLLYLLLSFNGPLTQPYSKNVIMHAIDTLNDTIINKIDITKNISLSFQNKIVIFHF